MDCEEPTSNYSSEGSSAFDEAAADFARLCPLQSESDLTQGHREMAVKPDGYNSGPEAFSDHESLQFDEIG
jgi:hypothetical protein